MVILSKDGLREEGKARELEVMMLAEDVSESHLRSQDLREGRQDRNDQPGLEVRGDEGLY